MRLKGLHCVITGGSNGIGAATVRRFVAEGAEVLIVDRDLDAANALANELGDAVSAVKCDVRLEPEVKAAAESAYEKWDHIDVLVNNAGSELNRSYDETTVDEWDRVLDTDLKGPWLVCKHFLQLTKK